MRKLLSLILVSIVLISCTQNTRTRKYGGTEKMTLEPHEKLISMSWKGSEGTDLWVLTTDTITHMSYFRESSSWGIWQGKIVVSPAGGDYEVKHQRDTVIITKYNIPKP